MYAFIDSPWFFVGLTAMILVPLELGYRIFRIRPPRGVRENRAIAGAVVTLLALILAYVTTEASTTYRNTMRFIGDETDAISETWRRAQLLDPPERTRFIQVLKDYMSVRVRPWPVDEAAISARQSQLWGQVRDLRNRYGDKASTTQLITSLQKMLGAYWRTDASAHQRVPLGLGYLVFGGIILVSALVGYSTGTRKRPSWVVKLIYFGMVMLTINAMRTVGRQRTATASASRQNLEGLYRAMQDEP